MRKEKSYQFPGGMSLALNAKRSFSIPKVNDLIELRLLIYGILTVAVAGPAVLIADWMNDFLREVVVRTTGGGIDGTSIAMDGSQIQKTAWFKKGSFPRYDAPALGIAANPFLMEVIIPFTPDGILEGQASLPARYCQTVDLDITLGVSTDVATPAGGGGTAVVSDLVILDAKAVEELGWGPGVERWVKSETRIATSETLAAADMKKLFDITGSGKLAAITIETETAAGADSDAILSDMIIKTQVKGGSQTDLAGGHFKSIQADNLSQYKVAQYLSGAPYTNVGIARWEFDKTGNGDPEQLVSIENYESVEFWAKCILAGKLWLVVETWKKIRYAA